MRDDTWSNDEAGASDAARILGSIEAIGGEVGDQEPNGLLATRLGPDPWLPWTCPRCGDEDRHGTPETCTCCGYRNFGRTA